MFLNIQHRRAITGTTFFPTPKSAPFSSAVAPQPWAFPWGVYGAMGHLMSHVLGTAWKRQQKGKLKKEKPNLCCLQVQVEQSLNVISLYLHHEDINQFIPSADLALTAAASRWGGLTLTGVMFHLNLHILSCQSPNFQPPPIFDFTPFLGPSRVAQNPTDPVLVVLIRGNCSDFSLAYGSMFNAV